MADVTTIALTASLSLGVALIAVAADRILASHSQGRARRAIEEALVEEVASAATTMNSLMDLWGSPVEQPTKGTTLGKVQVFHFKKWTLLRDAYVATQPRVTRLLALAAFHRNLQAFLEGLGATPQYDGLGVGLVPLGNTPSQRWTVADDRFPDILAHNMVELSAKKVQDEFARTAASAKIPVVAPFPAEKTADLAKARSAGKG